MAGEWIKVRTNLWSDPRVSQLCDLTECEKATVIGGLYWLWSTADEHTETGLMPGLSARAVDRESGIKGFGAALVAIGWIDDTPAGIILQRFDEHNGASAKTRAQTAKRVANHKNNAPLTQESKIANAPTVSDALPREEKRREEEEKKEQPTTVKAESPKKPDASGSRLPADWKPSQEDIAYCKTERPDLLPSKVAANFYDYWIAKPGAAGRKANWSATWRSWVRKEDARSAGRPAGGNGHLSVEEQNRINSAKAKEMLFGKRDQSPDDGEKGLVIENA